MQHTFLQKLIRVVLAGAGGYKVPTSKPSQPHRFKEL